MTRNSLESRLRKAQTGSGPKARNGGGGQVGAGYSLKAAESFGRSLGENVLRAC
ncbi:hypothetical protein P7K49_021191 [Saguinus oedipus]|uniref:Uncharacterized protein n=1 Tax=Saguinus oedipus TaxID=9490 RepID=A0ABQ9URZ5_SAGOE|nr:hypothetical protein P7K49_021191 [Saguinus oedipus]